MALFSNLPDPVGKARQRVADNAEEEIVVKRARLEESPTKENAQDGENAAPTTAAQSTPTVAKVETTIQAPGGDQCRAALLKIASHIGNPKRFAKAAPLLQELLTSGKLKDRHGRLVFEALRLSMVNPETSQEPTLRKAYVKLFTAASKHSELFTPKEKSQLDVFGLWAVLRNGLHTDDSFQLNKTLVRLKEMVSQLPEVSGDDDEALQALTKQMSDPAAAQVAPDLMQEEEEDSAVEADPFGLDALMSSQRGQRASVSSTWSSRECIIMRRVALMDCLVAAKSCYHHPWARTSVDLAIDALVQQRGKFTAGQQHQVDELQGFVRDQRARRRQGPSAIELRRDQTSFEAARAEWSKASVSTRGKVGAGGDHKTEMWLG